jgi:transcriptional regulator with XRE-family HTH domain
MSEKSNLAAFLSDIRAQKTMSLRDVEAATEENGTKISNAYLSQLEKGDIKNPSPHVLYNLAQVYGVPYERLMEEAGYIKPADQNKQPVKALYADDLSDDEFELAKEYIQMLRRRHKQQKNKE